MIAFTVGLILGLCVGLFIASCCKVASDADEPKREHQANNKDCFEGWD